ncbi:MAG: enolase C-terminal domain-like protein [Myxococcota bacterium]
MPMQIQSATLHRIQIPLKRSFSHALSERSGTDAVLVCLRDDQGNTGWGEVLPRPYVTGESVESVLTEHAPRLLGGLLGASLGGRDDAVAQVARVLADCEGALATVTGLELSLLDLAGKRFGFSLASCLGAHRGPELPAGVVIGFDTKSEKLARYCAVLRLSKKRHVKIKVGLADDVERCRTVAGVFGPDVPLRLDANAAWSPEQAVRALAEIAEVCTIHSIEQPVAREDIAGLAKVRRESGVPVMADESVCSLQDAERLIAADAADIFNVRAGKHGGVLASRTLCERAQAAGVRLHLGTLVGETGILSRAAEVFGRCQPGLDCLDGKGQNAWLLQQDVLLQPSEGSGAPSIDALGLGVEVDPDRVAALRVQPAVTIR